MLFLTLVITQFNLYTNICSYKYGHNSGPKGSPGMIWNAFHVKFDKKKDEIPPRAHRPNEMGPPPARPLDRGVWGAAAPLKEKRVVRGAPPRW